VEREMCGVGSVYVVVNAVVESFWVAGVVVVLVCGSWEMLVMRSERFACWRDLSVA
jgi:hypothetical protein